MLREVDSIAFATVRQVNLRGCLWIALKIDRVSNCNDRDRSSLLINTIGGCVTSTLKTNFETVLLSGF